MQSEAFRYIYDTDENCVISSPTGSGKTVLFELAILRLLRDNNYSADNIKILYIAPTKSLCYEQSKNWSSKFLNLSVGMLTSDTSYSETDKVRNANIIITTPEKWDLLTRKWEDYKRLFELVKLILVDEIHMLKERRGSALEVVLTRMNYMYEDIRIVAVSATIPNIEDVSEWLRSGKKFDNRAARVLKFDDSYRQVQLEKHVYGYNMSGKNEFQKDSVYNSKLDEILNEHGKGRPVLVFCPTRASTVSTAKFIATQSYARSASNSKNIVQFNDSVLVDCYRSGVAFHHAGLSLEDRRLVEEEFLKGNIMVLCSTTTLAVGVNLPAYLVIIKGTRMWSASETQEYSDLDILQMIGRAGRPDFESEGCGIILTDISMKSKYINLVNGTANLESSLHLDLIEHLTAEISLKTIISTKTAVKWLKNTFLYVRFCRNPSRYSQIHKFKKQSSGNDFQLFQFCQMLLDELEANEIIEKICDEYCCTSFGMAMARHYIYFDSMKSFIKSRDSLGIQEVLNLLARSKEFDEVRVRHIEKRLYKEINLSPLIRYPYLTDKKQSRIIDSTYQKVSLIIQYELGGLEFPSYPGSLKLHQSLVQDKMSIFRHSFRIMRCMIDTFIAKKDGISLKNSLFLLRCITGSCWEDSPMVLRQLKNVGLIAVRKFVNHGVSTLDDVLDLNESQVGYYLNINPTQSLKILKDVEGIPKLEINVKAEKFDFKDGKILVFLRIEIVTQYVMTRWHGQSLTIDVQILKDSGEFVDFRRIKLMQLKVAKSYRISTFIKSQDDSIKFIMNCQEIAGIGKEYIFNENDIPRGVFHDHRFNSKFNKSRNCARSTIEEIERDIFSSSDDSLVSYLNENKSNINNSSVVAAKNETVTLHGIEDIYERRKIKFNGNYECNHVCKDKLVCRHLCCREGIPVNYMKKRTNNDIKQIDRTTISANTKESRVSDTCKKDGSTSDSYKFKTKSNILNSEMVDEDTKLQMRNSTPELDSSSSSSQDLISWNKTNDNERHCIQDVNIKKGGDIFHNEPSDLSSEINENLSNNNLNFLGSDIEFD
ncbi:hypothetical protein Kpol_489p5 [Vanderwaltozyma polyspora DSM 70294]|uniref:DNA 3'-5' helicase n=1 Tax=Vanderwaltozyma polyspora (strain ATCC 22028 / DSM 70294 / BCRC 21397 / CBS 2163 / NBRC 10782 / NRRL Y-8283 / UCD 57-17) TaxID=436907 RepID=A7TQ19_VANPO|nr:uncharacterized protein Kpol_489p5 [Vanderwaltozyma polyspora DSM 70294]EDO15624.1 hypothetical protein Kpol_489p5 [Vanderwaltozyma polyspora DSM 70294]